MPSFAELRERAMKARDSGINKLHETRDRYSSRSSKDMDWESDHRHPIPSPSTPSPTRPNDHTRTSSAASIPSARPPPPPRHHDAPPIVRSDSRPSPQASHPPTPTLPPRSVHISHSPTQAQDSVSTAKIDWAHLSAEDKEIFFSWLDEFFERKFNITISKRHMMLPAQTIGRSITPDKEPPINMSSRPTLPARDPRNSASFSLSYPPPTTHGSAALDLASYFSPATHWDSAWYTSGELAPPLKDGASPNWTASWSSQGSMKTIHAGILFSDLSMCWYSVTFSTTSHSNPNDTRAVIRSAQYLPRPAPQDKDTLIAASETYGETIAAFAESFVGTGQYCARGECWDLASEALKQFEQYDYVPPPVPSISRTHGHLIFEGKADNNGVVQFGRWRGGDDRVRRGDIVEWRNARVGMGPYGHATLGNPDHTAVIISETVPRVAVADGQAVKPSEVGVLQVVEQSVGSPPKSENYDLGQMQEGEIWVYRPIAMEVYVGATLEAQCPKGVPAISI